MFARIGLSLLFISFLGATIVAEENARVRIKAQNIVVAGGAGGAAQVQVIKKATKAQREATKKLAEAMLEQSNATKSLAEAKKAEATAKGDEAKQAAAKKVAEAEAKLEEAKKAVVKQREALRKAAAQRIVVRGGYPRVTVAVRENVDLMDQVERFALLLPGGPVVVEAAMTIDGEPFRVVREKLIGEMIDSIKKDEDGNATWDEALKSNRFTLGRIRISNDAQRKSYTKALDKNQNGQVDRAEVRQFVAQYFQGPAFTVGGGYGYGGSYAGGIVLVNGQAVSRGAGGADVRKLLDTDSDGVLDEKEIAAAGERLKSRDANDNDLLEPNELAGGAAANNTRVSRFVGQPQMRQQSAVLLGPTAKAGPLFQSLQQRYKNDDGDIVSGSFTSVPKLFETLDKNKDGKLGQDEVLGLNEVKPHVELAVDLGKAKGAKGLTLKSLAKELKNSKESGESMSVELPGVKLSLLANVNAPQTYNYERTATSYLTRYDKDSNGYLDKDELAGNLARMMQMWDGDNDGKVYAKEITASYERMQAPGQSQIRATTANQGNSLFQALDQSGDGRLSLREMRTADQRIKTFDDNKDNRITQDEIPATVSVTFALGNTGYYRRTVQFTRPAGNQRTNRDGPSWFTGMDRNGDGDVTLKEFLGSAEDFKKLDTNGDGFIELKEAKAAKPSEK